MKKNLLFIFSSLNICLSILCLNSCDEAELVPSYIYITEADFQTAEFEGSASHGIQNVWLFVNNQSVGVYQLPAEIPVLIDGDASANLRGGIANNGIFSTEIIYPFYLNFSFDISDNPAQKDTIRPVFEYIPDLQFPFINDFEVGNGFRNNGGQAALLLTSKTSEVFEGKRSGIIKLDEIAKDFSIATIEEFELPSGLQAVFLELDYQCNKPFLVALQSRKLGGTLQLVETPILVINSQENWNKIYVDLTSVVSSLALDNFTQHRIIFESSITSEEGSGTFSWDNIKIVHQ